MRQPRLVAALFDLVMEVEHVEQVADRQAVHWHVWTTLIRAGVRQIVAAAPSERREVPVALDEFQDRDVVAIAVHDMPARSQTASTIFVAGAPPPRR